MKHFIGTRFNLKAPEWRTTKNGDAVLTEDWLEKRFYLFENYCFPSVVHQTNQNFIWCVFFDNDTPAEYKEKIKIIAADYLNFRPLFIDSMGTLKNTFQDYIYMNIEENDEYVITSRLDNDDLIHKDFIKTIQSLFIPLDGAVIDLKNGFQVTLDSPISQIRVYNHDFNAFVSVIENVKKIETIYSRKHHDWRSSKNIIGYQNKRLWIELTHETNKVNCLLTYLKKAWMFNIEDFSLPKEFVYKLDILDVCKTNLNIEIERFRKFQNKWFNFLVKLPKRTRLFLLKKLNLNL